MPCIGLCGCEAIIAQSVLLYSNTRGRPVEISKKVNRKALDDSKRGGQRFEGRVFGRLFPLALVDNLRGRTQLKSGRVYREMKMWCVCSKRQESSKRAIWKRQSSGVSAELEGNVGKRRA